MKITNHGQEIIETDYWGTEHNRGGYCFLSWNAGTARLLLPDALEPQLREMRTAKEVIVSFGPLVVNDTSGRWDTRDALELLFEDGSDNPYAIHIGVEQSDRLLPKNEHGRSFDFTVWTRQGEQLRLPGRYRVVASLPWLKPE